MSAILNNSEDALMVNMLFARYALLMQEVVVEASPSSIQEAYRRLLRKYTSRDRVFHSVHRLVSCIEEFDRMSAVAKRPNEVLMAVFYQYVVYDVRQINNAFQSGKYFQFVAKHLLGIEDNASIARVARMIECGDFRNAIPPETIDEYFFCDLQKAILGADAQDYDRQMQSLRIEYGYLDNSDWALVRTNFIDTILFEESIYHTPALRSRYEESARANLMQERVLLQRNAPVN